ncbi:MAG: hypothetical protein KGD57_06540 [Candidatus Lokiarchaeota archaeon]|nr:hypothetical protein [Candidatus Lokiarchaeota archaeon]
MAEKNINKNDTEQEKKKKKIRKKLAYLEKIEEFTVSQNNHFILGKLPEAIKVSEQIIEIAKEGKLQSTIEEQEEYIRKCNLLIEKNKIIKNIKGIFEDIKPKYKRLTEEGNIKEAHKVILNFKKNYGNKIKLESISEIRSLLVEEREKWNELMEKQEVIKLNLSKLEKKMKESLDSYDFKSAENILKNSRKYREELVESNIIKIWNDLEEKYSKTKDSEQLKKEVKKVIAECKELEKGKLYVDAKVKLNSLISILKDKDLPSELKILEDIKKEISKAEKIYKKKINRLQELENKLEDAQEKNQFKSSIYICENIIQIAKDLEDIDKENMYIKIIDDLNVKLKESKDIRERQIHDLNKKAKELENIINLNEDILPLVDKFSVEDLIGTLSDDIGEMIKQLDSLLIDHRVDIKNIITNKSLLNSKSGEIIELEKNFIVRPIKKDDYSGDLQPLRVRSGFENTFSDIIEEAILSDLIPYNFEITNMELNGNPVEQKSLPEKKLTGSGLELIWKVENIKPYENVEINYDLRKRISRTIIFVLENQINIIKTHSNIKRQDTEGLYDVKLLFSNKYAKHLKGVVIEDIIPNYYLNTIIEPRNIKPSEIVGSNLGNLVKWNITSMDNEKINHHYKLLELYKYEELKRQINKLNKEGLEYLENTKISDAIKIFQDLKQQLVNYIE